jgi:hypothetical protein
MSTLHVTTDASIVSDSVDPLSNTSISHNISDMVIHDVNKVPQVNPAVSETTTPNDLNAPVVIVMFLRVILLFQMILMFCRLPQGRFAETHD